MPQIILSTLNARHLHASLGLRYLKANMGELSDETVIMEFTLDPRPVDIAERLLALRPRIIGLGVYIWNLEQTTRLVALLKALSPQTLVVLGGPEVSHEWDRLPLVAEADYLITGQADLSFSSLCRRLIDGIPPADRVIHADPPPLQRLASPYPYYTGEDIASRLIYVEASRGCPFKCEFCLSALDRTAWPFDIPAFLGHMEELLRRGARHFKFVDRTFNLKLTQSLAILDFFLEHMEEGLFLHFEVIPDRLPQALKTRLRRFPPGTLQLEVGIQSFDSAVQARINRSQDNARTRENLAWLRSKTQAHIHADLIIGLPGEGLAGFASGFDQLVGLAPHEIQLVVLKRLRGTPITRHAEAFQMLFNPCPPYDLLSSRDLDFSTLQRLTRFARFWDLIANSGRFRNSLPLILGERPCDRFLALSDWIFEETEQVHRIALQRLFELVDRGMSAALKIDEESRLRLLGADWEQTRARGLPAFLNRRAGRVRGKGPESGGHTRRQGRHH